MAQTVSISDLYKRFDNAFGFSPTFLNPKVVGAAVIKGAARFQKFPTYDPVDPAYAEMFFENNVTGDIYTFGIDEMEKGTSVLPFVKAKPVNRRFLAPPMMVSFTRGKHVVETPIDRSNHVVIENFGNKAYQIKMQGILIDVAEHQYPGDLLQEVHRMFEAPGTYKVTGDIFHDLNIMEIFFKDGFNIGFVEGFADTVKFSVNAVSVEAAEFLIK